MNYDKQKINVFMKKALSPNEVEEVDAILVGGKEGVFAVWRDGDLIHLAYGDDGTWREMGCYHSNWMNDIINAIGTVC